MNDTILETGNDSKESVLTKLYNYIQKNPFVQSYYNIFSDKGQFNSLNYSYNNEDYYQKNDASEIKKEESNKNKVDVLNDVIKDYTYNPEKQNERYKFFNYNNELLNEEKKEEQQQKNPYFATREEFIQEILPDLIEVATQYNINPYVMLSQAILETGNGRSIKGNNLFGIKGKGQEFLTTEEINGETVKIKDSFDAYNNFRESMEAYANYITTKHGGKMRVRGTAFEDVAREIDIIKNQQKFATDSDYERKIIQISKEIRKYIDNYNK